MKRILLALIAICASFFVGMGPASAANLTGYDVPSQYPYVCYVGPGDLVFCDDITIYHGTQQTHFGAAVGQGPYHSFYLSACRSDRCQITHFLGQSLNIQPGQYPSGITVRCWTHGQMVGFSDVWDYVYVRDAGGHHLWGWFPDWWMYSTMVGPQCGSV